jgi:prepilin-type N-terminal cleavage/methylation domain-containing protein
MSRRPRSGFTLVELLVVIVIISLLAALITPAVMAGMRAAKRATITAEISSLHQAIETYKAQYGSYPPSTKAAFQNHLRNIFININDSEVTGLQDMNQAEILVFALRGYSPDKRRPITGSGERKPLFDFKPDRLTTTTNGAIYTAPNTSATPYVYFDLSRGGTPSNFSGTGGTIGPYKMSGGGSYANAKSFQIISTGLDNEFGGGSVELKTGDISGGHSDNLTNFAGGSQLIDYIDQ